MKKFAAIGLLIAAALYSCNRTPRQIVCYEINSPVFKYTHRMVYVNPNNSADTMYYYFDSNDSLLPRNELPKFELGEKNPVVRMRRLCYTHFLLRGPIRVNPLQTEFIQKFRIEYWEEMQKFGRRPMPKTAADEQEERECQSTDPRHQYRYVEQTEIITTTTQSTNPGQGSSDIDWGIYGDVPRDNSGREIYTMPNGESKVWDGANWVNP